MKNLKKPTYAQKRIIAKAGLNPKEYLVKEESDTSLTLVSKSGNEIVELSKK